MHVLVFHGYLLRGTGSNVYNARLVPALVRAGHSVDLLAQDALADELDWVDAIGTLAPDGAVTGVEVLREPVGVTVWQPDIGGLLPVYVKDRYPGFTVKTFVECSDDEVESYVAANARAIVALAARRRPDLALINHLVMGPLAAARGLPSGVPYAVKVHGSDLEYAVAWTPSASSAPRRRASRAPRRCSSDRATRHAACSSCSTTRTCRSARAWARLASTRRRSARARLPRRRPACARSPSGCSPGPPGPTTEGRSRATSTPSRAPC